MRIVAHIDMDAFYASIEERDTPRFHGLPLAVGADPDGGKGRGVVTTANYKAREYGIHSAMPISKAWQLSESAKRQGKPPVVFVHTEMAKYRAVSAKIMGVIRRFTPIVEEAGIDEAYSDVSLAGSWDKAEEVCRDIKREILAQERLTCSFGIGPNKLIAKIASNHHKPDGLTVVRQEQSEAFLAPLPIRVIPGIGPKTEEELARLRIRRVEDLKQYSHVELKQMLGNYGLELYEKIRGRDNSPIEQFYEVKSISEQETFEEDTCDSTFIGERLKEMCESVMRRMATEGFVGFRTAGVTVRFADFETKSRSHSLGMPGNSAATLHVEALKLLLPFLDGRENPRRKMIRLIGVKIEKLQPEADETPSLF